MFIHCLLFNFLNKPAHVRAVHEVAWRMRYIATLPATCRFPDQTSKQLFIIFYSRVGKQWRQETKPNDSAPQDAITKSNAAAKERRWAITCTRCESSRMVII
jgi:hypothetical protein